MEGADLVNAVKRTMEEKKDDIKAIVDSWIAGYNTDETTDEKMFKMGALALTIKNMCDEFGCNCVAGECWSLTDTFLGIAPCFVWGWLSSQGLPVSCETDVLGHHLHLHPFGRGPS